MGLWKAGMYGDVSLSDGIIEYAKTHEEIKGAFLTFQKDADQIYPGWKEQLGYTGESSVQAASFDWKKKASAAGYAGGAPPFYYAKPTKAYCELVFGNDVGYLPDGTAMHKAGNMNNHPEMACPDPHVAGSPLPKASFGNDVGYLPDGTAYNKAGNMNNHPEMAPADPHTPGAPSQGFRERPRLSPRRHRHGDCREHVQPQVRVRTKSCRGSGVNDVFFPVRSFLCTVRACLTIFLRMALVAHTGWWAHFEVAVEK